MKRYDGLLRALLSGIRAHMVDKFAYEMGKSIIPVNKEGLEDALDVMKAPVGKGELLNQSLLSLLPARK